MIDRVFREGGLNDIEDFGIIVRHALTTRRFEKYALIYTAWQENPELSKQVEEEVGSEVFLNAEIGFILHVFDRMDDKTPLTFRKSLEARLEKSKKRLEEIQKSQKL